MRDKGVTLIELLVVIAIIGILAIALGFSYQGWVARYRIESEIKQIYTDLMDARMRAMSRAVIYFADFPDSMSYRITEDTNSNGALNIGAGDNVLATFPKIINNTHTLNWNGGAIAGIIVLFERRGVITLPGGATAATIRITSTTTTNPDYDCITISQTRINMGLINTATGACDEK